MAVGGAGTGNLPDVASMSASDFIFLAKNADRVDAIMQQFAQAQAQLDAKVALAGDAGQIVALKAAARDSAAAAAADRTAAAQELADAQENAGHIRAAAKTDAKAITDVAMAGAAGKLSEAQQLLADAETERRGMADRSAALDAREAGLTAREDAAGRAQGDAETAQAAYETKLANLQKAMAGL